jgi:hypothetical protein
VLRAALIDKLRSIEISLVPYSRDASPKELEYRQITPPKPPN